MDAKALLEFMRGYPLAVAASVSGGGDVQAAVVGVAVTDRFEIVFDTLESTRKAANLRRNPKVAFVLGGATPGEERTVQYEGVADEPTGVELERIKQAYYAAHSDGPTRLSWDGLIYVRVRPTWIRYSDYSLAKPTIIEFIPDQLAI